MPDALRAMRRWATGPRELLERGPTAGVKHFQSGEEHKPWASTQFACADVSFSGLLRRAYTLARYTGQRVSEIVLLGWTDIDDGGFARPQKKTTNQLWKLFDKARDSHSVLQGAVWHGLRANAVVHLRQSGYSGLQISDMIGISGEMVERYSRHADRKAAGQAVLRELSQGRDKNEPVKP